MTVVATATGFTLTRTLSASPEQVFRAWTEPEHLTWFFNDETTTDVPIELDLRVGGAWRQMMVENADKSYVTGGIYREIVPYERLVFTWGAEGGWPALDPEHLDDGPLATVTLTPVGAGTEMAFHLELPAGISEQEARDWFALGILEGMTQTLNRFVPAR